MKRVISFILALVLTLSLVACGNNNEPAPTETKAKTDVAEPLTWEQIDALPIANDSMSEEDLRQICLDFMRLMLTITWTPETETTYNNGKSDKTFYVGSVYAGIPYVSNTFGNLYTIMEYYDSDNGMLDISGGQETIEQFSNQCSSSSFWAWSRVCNTMPYTRTAQTSQRFGYLRVGDYTYDDNMLSFREKATTQICVENGPDVMFEAYAKLKPADGVTNFKSAGHTRMIAAVPNVVRDANGNIDGTKSTVTYLDQIRNWTPGTQSNGAPYEVEGGVDVKVTFFDLFNGGYLPFTIAELNKNATVEKSETVMDYTEDSISIAQLRAANVSSNYPVSDITITVKDSAGNEVYRKFAPAYLNLPENPVSIPVSIAVTAEKLQQYTDGKHTVEVSARIGTGEKPVIYTGTLTA